MNTTASGAGDGDPGDDEELDRSAWLQLAMTNTNTNVSTIVLGAARAADPWFHPGLIVLAPSRNEGAFEEAMGVMMLSARSNRSFSASKNSLNVRVRDEAFGGVGCLPDRRATPSIGCSTRIVAGTC